LHQENASSMQNAWSLKPYTCIIKMILAFLYFQGENFVYKSFYRVGIKTGMQGAFGYCSVHTHFIARIIKVCICNLIHTIKS